MGRNEWKAAWLANRPRRGEVREAALVMVGFPQSPDPHQPTDAL